MTIQFQGHVKSIAGGFDNTVRVTLCTPMKEADGVDWIIHVPREHAADWLPNRIVSFTLYTLPEPAKKQGLHGLSALEAFSRVTSGTSGEV